MTTPKYVPKPGEQIVDEATAETLRSEGRLTKVVKGVTVVLNAQDEAEIKASWDETIALRAERDAANDALIANNVARLESSLGMTLPEFKRLLAIVKDL